MMSHTKEPWHVAPGGDYCDIVCQDHVDIARTDVEEDARRIVACVNACANVTDEMFANGWPAIGHSKYCYLLTKQRDELLSKVAAWEQKSANWMASPEAAQRLDGYRDIAQRLNVAEQQRDNLLAALNDAATSLETIAIRSYGESSCLDSKQQMRGFAGSRAAVESAMRDANVPHHAEMAANAVICAAAEYERPSVLFRPKLSIDGNQWCALYGDNPQDGVAGFGDSPTKAMWDFDRAWQKDLPSNAIVSGLPRTEV